MDSTSDSLESFLLQTLQTHHPTDTPPTHLTINWLPTYDRSSLALIPTYFPDLTSLTFSTELDESPTELDVLTAVAGLRLREVVFGQWVNRWPEGKGWDAEEGVPTWLRTVEKIEVGGRTMEVVLDLVGSKLGGSVLRLKECKLLGFTTPDVFAGLLSQCPALEVLDVTLKMKLKDVAVIDISHPTLRDLQLAIDPKSVSEKKLKEVPPLRIGGKVPCLKKLRLKAMKPKGGLLKIDAAALRDLVRGCGEALDVFEVMHPNAWRVVRDVCDSDAGTGVGPDRIPKRVEIHQVNKGHARIGESSEDDWEAYREIVEKGWPVDPACLVPLLDHPSRCEQLARLLQQLTSLDLNYQHGPESDNGTCADMFLLQTPTLLLTTFPNLTDLYIFNAGALTTERLHTIVSGLPHLTSLRLINNHNPNLTKLHLKSSSLTTLVLTHFHELDTVHVDCPNLTDLEFDNCDSNTLSSQVTEPGQALYYSNFCEKFLADLLRTPSPSASPSLDPSIPGQQKQRYG
ncbi:hypothetical protein HK102_005300, partial [Quaeritorhiza haematococci]